MYNQSGNFRFLYPVSFVTWPFPWSCLVREHVMLCWKQTLEKMHDVQTEQKWTPPNTHTHSERMLLHCYAMQCFSGLHWSSLVFSGLPFLEGNMPKSLSWNFSWFSLLPWTHAELTEPCCFFLILPHLWLIHIWSFLLNWTVRIERVESLQGTTSK